MLITLMISVAAMKSKAFSNSSYSVGVKEVGGSVARHIVQGGQWKYSMTQTS